MARIVCLLAVALLGEAFGQPDAGRALQGTQSDELPSVDDVFQRWDTNRDGRLSRDEIPEGTRERMLRADANRDGAVTRKELDEARARRGQGPATNRPGIDRPSAGRVEGSQPVARRTPESAAESPYPTVTNISVSTLGNAGQREVVFDLSWASSWRSSPETANWDAAWVFVKFRRAGDSDGFRHARLDIQRERASITDLGGVAAAVAVTADGLGAFLYRSEVGRGTNNWHGVRLCWRATDDGVSPDAQVDVRVFAIAMVYVPAGDFFVGDGLSPGRFHAGGDPSQAYRVTRQPIELKNSPGGLWADHTRTPLPAGAPGPDPWDNPTGILPPTFPSGVRGFYIMKFEMTQGDYAAFLNTLDARQAAARFPTESEFSGVRATADNYRYSIRRVNEQFQATAPSRANNWMNWEDGIAFCDWAGLRPMSELEFEKACRGPLQPVSGEYAWGATTIAATTGIAGVDGSGSETPLPADANTNFSRTLSGPLRAGIHVGKATREARGESFYGVHDLSGNVVEMAVNISSFAGRGFRGEHGDGAIGADGRASDVLSWPRIPASPRGAFSTDDGFGYRGGDFWNPELDLRVSSRNVARFSGTRRLFGLGFRGVRTAGDAL